MSISPAVGPWVTIDSDARTISVETFDNSKNDVYQVTIVATGTEKVNQEISFDLDVQLNCGIKNITLPIPVDQTYKVNDPQASYSVPKFGNDDSVYCSLSYSIVQTPIKSWLTRIGDTELEWFTDTNSQIGIYLIKIVGTDP